MTFLMHTTTLVRRNKNYLLARLHTVQLSIPAVFLMLFQPGAWITWKISSPVSRDLDSRLSPKYKDHCCPNIKKRARPAHVISP